MQEKLSKIFLSKIWLNSLKNFHWGSFTKTFTKSFAKRKFYKYFTRNLSNMKIVALEDVDNPKKINAAINSP